MGDGLRLYKPSFSIHSIANDLLAPKLIQAFRESAILLQLKKIPDVSFYQGVINFLVMRQKTNAVILRAGQNLWVDSQFVRNWAEARRAGMKRGSYWFYDSRVSPRQQSDIWIGLLKNDRPEMEIWVDWEIEYGGSYRGLARVIEMIDIMRAAGFIVGIYTGYYWFRGNSNAMTNAAQYNYIRNNNIPLWEAWYTPSPSIVLVPAPFAKIFIWQFGTPSSVGWGVQSAEIDMNFINMTEQEFDARYGATIPPIGGVMEDKYYKVTASALNIRSSAENLGTANDIGDLQGGDILHTIETVLNGGITWKQFDKVWRSGVPIMGNVSPTGKYFAAEKGVDVWMVETTNPIPDPPSAMLPAYFTAHDASGNELARYNKQ